MPGTPIVCTGVRGLADGRPHDLLVLKLSAHTRSLAGLPCALFAFAACTRCMVAS